MAAVCNVLRLMQRGEFALFFLPIAASVGIAASAQVVAKRKALRRAHGMQAEAEDAKVLIERLSRAEALAKSEREALIAQQQVLVALEDEQAALDARETTLEANERALASGKIVTDKGTLSNAKKQSPIIRQNVKADHMKVIEVKTPSQLGAQKNPNPKGFFVLLRESEQEFWARNNKAFYEKMTAMVIYMVLVFTAGFLYMQYCRHAPALKVPEREVRTEEFQWSPFDASDVGRDLQMCVCALCCPWIRWADNASAPHIQFLAFLPALFITAVLASASSVTFGASLPMLLLVTVLCRQRIREAYGLPAGTCKILCCDCLLWVCCPCCAIVQEARQIEYVEVPLQQYG